MREIDIIDESMKQINNETLVGWVVWFCDGGNIQKFNSKEHDWVDIPKIGIQYFYRVYEANYMEQVAGADYYCPYQLMDVEDIRPWIKFGLMIDLDKLNTIFDEVKDFTLEDFNNL
jgi:hypothetical protein